MSHHRFLFSLVLIVIFAEPKLKNKLIIFIGQRKYIPYHIAMDMLYTGRWMDAEEAHRWGLVNEIHAADKLHDRVWEVAEQLEAGPPLVFAAIKEVARETEGLKFQDALNRITKSQFETVDTLYHSEDGLEGFKAFAEKRDPIWKGK